MIKQQSIENFQSYSQFDSLKDFNNNIEAFLFDHKASFTASELIAFKRLTKFGAKVYGVATASLKTILNAIEDKANGYGISESTFHRMRRKAVKLGVLSIIHTERKNGSQSSNIWIFNRYLKEDASFCQTNDTPNKKLNTRQHLDDTEVKQKSTGEELTAHNTSNLSKTSKSINKRCVRGKKLSTEENIKNMKLDASYTSSRVPKEFTQLTSNFYDCQETIEELWRVVKVSTFRTLYDASIVLKMAQESFKQLIRHVKRGKVTKTIYALYWGIVNKKLDELYFESLYDAGFPV